MPRSLLPACFLVLVSACSPPSTSNHFESAEECQNCHPMQFQEWSGSVMHYAAVSPVFNAFELTVEKLTNGQFAPNGSPASFCSECHSPVSRFRGEISDFRSPDSAKTLVSDMSKESQEGVTCDFCHRVTGPDFIKSPTRDGIANLSLHYSPSPLKLGPYMAPTPNEFHLGANSDFLRSSQFCGGCHDVRIPKPDVVTGEPFQRLENLFTEWESSPYATIANRYGRVVRCQDCHMSLFPMTEPGVFPEVPIADDPDQPGTPARRHALHAFTAVSIPLISDDRFQTTDTPVVDSFGYPLGQQQRRAQLLRAACTMSLAGTPGTVAAGSTLPIRITVENVGAGHNVPAGFSQEREVWIELTVSDASGIIYESGYLHDSAHPETGEMIPDGLLHDEDLEHRHFEIELETFHTVYQAGPDVDMRPQGINRGITSFQNNFMAMGPNGQLVQTLNPLEADHMDNSRSLPPLQPRVIAYDVPIPPGRRGQIQVRARLRYRSFPPEFLRFLAQREPDLVSEAHVDANTIVDMAEASMVVQSL